MLFMLVNRTRPNLTPEQFQALGQLAQGFYDNVPEGVRLIGDWAATDHSRTFALVEVERAEQIEEIQAPFSEYVEIETVAVVPVSGWGSARGGQDQ